MQSTQDQPPHPPQQPQPPDAGFVPSVQAQPAPTQFVITPLQTPSGSFVVIQVFTVAGNFVFFVDTPSAKNLATQISRAAGSASTGLILPPGFSG